MKNIALFVAAVLVASCSPWIGNSEINNVVPVWHYMRSTDPGYSGRDKGDTGNCEAYAREAKSRLIAAGYDPSRIKLESCIAYGGAHMVCVVDGHRVYGVGERWVLEKDSLDWEWIGTPGYK